MPFRPGTYNVKRRAKPAIAWDYSDRLKRPCRRVQCWAKTAAGKRCKKCVNVQYYDNFRGQLCWIHRGTKKVPRPKGPPRKPPRGRRKQREPLLLSPVRSVGRAKQPGPKPKPPRPNKEKVVEFDIPWIKAMRHAAKKRKTPVRKGAAKPKSKPKKKVQKKAKKARSPAPPSPSYCRQSMVAQAAQARRARYALDARDAAPGRGPRMTQQQGQDIMNFMRNQWSESESESE